MIECGAKQGDVDKTTSEYGLVTTLGQASFVGASGSGLLLGMGLLGRSYGFTIDNLHAMGTVLCFLFFEKFNFCQQTTMWYSEWPIFLRCILFH